MVAAVVCPRRLRVAGLHGLQGIVNKTIADDLQCNIWKPEHMNKIMPSLMVNLEHGTWSDECYER